MCEYPRFRGIYKGLDYIISFCCLPLPVVLISTVQLVVGLFLSDLAPDCHAFRFRLSRLALSLAVISYGYFYADSTPLLLEFNKFKEHRDVYAP